MAKLGRVKHPNVNSGPQGARSARHPKIRTTIVRRAFGPYRSSYTAAACIAAKNPSISIVYRNGKIHSAKCGYGNGKTPTSALKGALRKLASKIR